jgi:hypothetical protein
VGNDHHQREFIVSGMIAEDETRTDFGC